MRGTEPYWEETNKAVQARKDVWHAMQYCIVVNEWNGEAQRLSNESLEAG